MLWDCVPLLAVPLHHGKAQPVLAAHALLPLLKTAWARQGTRITVRGEDSAAAAVAVNKAARRTSNLAIIPHDGAPGEILVLEDIEKFEVGRGGAELGLKL